MSVKHKIKAGALQLTIFIVVIIALLLSAFLIFIHTQKQFETQTNMVLETIESANQGIEYVLENNTRLNDTVILNIHDEKYKTIKVHRSLWGIFERIVSISAIKNKKSQRVALVGAVQPEKNRIALYLEDNNKPLIVVGTTKIQGTAYLPEQGIRPGNISGESYYGSRLLYGMHKQSDQLLPISSEIQKNIKTIQYKSININKSQFLDISKKQIFHNSFFDPVNVIYKNNEIILANIELTGHILIQSNTKITVRASAHLTDVILIAPKIEITNNVVGAFQAFATENILIGENTKLNYPSALILNEKKIVTRDSLDKVKPHYIILKKNASVEGVVAYLGKEYTPSNYQPQFVIEEKASIKGEVYCTGNLVLNGDVYGSIFTANFLTKRFGTIYQNHLYNSKILIGKLPEEYVGLLFKNSNKGIAKWLY